MPDETLPIELCEVSSAEAAAVGAMARRIWPVCYREVVSQEQIDYMLDWMYSVERVRSDMAAGVRYRWLRSGEENVGFAAFGPGEVDGEGFLHKLYVLIEEQGRGYGSTALGMIEDEMRAMGLHTLVLRVNRANHGALHVYRKFGMTVREELCSDIGGGFVMDDFVMAKPLG